MCMDDPNSGSVKNYKFPQGMWYLSLCLIYNNADLLFLIELNMKTPRFLELEAAWRNLLPKSH